MSGLLTATDHEQLANRLYQAASRGEALTPLSNDYPQMESADSYAIQARLVAKQGSSTVGYKLGFTSAAMRDQMGVDEPNYGVLLAATQATTEVSFSRFIHPLIEPEIAIVTGRELAGDNVSLEAIGAGVARYHPALEIVDSRFQNYQFQAVDNIADNSSAAGYCLGDGVAAARLAGCEEVVCNLSKNREPIATGRGSDALGGPWRALQWLVHKLAEAGQSLPAASLVLTGGLSRAQPAGPGDEFRAEFSDGLGEVVLRFTD